MRPDTILSDDFNPGMNVADREARANSRRPRQQGQDRPQPHAHKKAARHTVRRTPAIVRFFRDKRTHLFLGITFFCMAIYMLIITISYFSSGIADQSLVMNKTISEMAMAPHEVENAGGPLGATLSHDFISEGLGIGSLVIIFYFFALGMSLLKLKHFSFWSLTMKCLIVAVTVSMVLGLVTMPFGTWFYWGGVHGYEANRFLIDVSGPWGATAVSILLVSLVVVLFFNDLRCVYIAYRRKVDARNARLRAEREAREAQRRHVEESLEQSSREVEEAGQQPPAADEEIDNDAPVPQVDPVEFGHEFEDVVDETDDIDDSDIVKHETRHLPVADDDEDETTDTLHDDPENVGLSVKVNEIEQAVEINTDVYDPTAELARFRFPTIDLLNDVPMKATSVDQQEMEENKERITKTLISYDIPISRIEATVGPTVTLYEIIPAEGVRIAKIKRLEDDIALSLAALGIRIIAPIPGKGTIGIEVPNKEPQMVPIRSIISSRRYQECTYDLPMAMGSTISKDVFIADLAKIPHLLVAGATGQGKSVGLNTIIASLLYKKHPAELKFVLVDPKMVEFSLYSKLERHYLAKLPDEEEAIITDPMKVVATLNSLCIEMDNRYSLLKEANVRSIKEYNARFVQHRLNPEKGHRFLPYIVIIIDEFGDLIMTAGKEVETPIARIAQKARAVGMHMILATQRPSTNVITGIIKANFPGRIAFRVAQMVDSKTILDRTGANQLIGKGDMLFALNGEMTRVQCAYIDTVEVENICQVINDQIGYDEAYPLPEYVPDNDGGGNMGAVNDRDALFEEAARFIVLSNTASTSSLQRRYAIGYNRAGKLMDQLEAAGIVGPASGAKPRQVLVDSLQLERMLESIG